MAIDYNTEVGQVRLLIADVNESNLVLTDDQIDGLLAMEAGVKRAAAAALDAIAVSEVLVSKVIRSQDLTTDGAKVADALRALARQLRGQADEDDNAGFLDVIEFHPYPGPEATEQAI